MTTKNTTQPNVSKIINISVLVISTIVFICLITGEFLLGNVGKAVSSFFLGVFGIAIYGVAICGIVIPSLLLAGKKIAVRKNTVISLALLYVGIILLVHCVTSTLYAGTDVNYGTYLANSFDFYSYPTFGGVLSGIIVYPVYKTLSWGAYVLFIGILAFTVYYSAITLNKAVLHEENAKKFIPQEEEITHIAQKVATEEKPDSELDKSLKILYGGKETSKPIVDTTANAAPAPKSVVTSYPSAPTSIPDKKEQNGANNGDIKIVRAYPVTYSNTEVLNADQLAAQLRKKREQDEQAAANKQNPTYVEPTNSAPATPIEQPKTPATTEPTVFVQPDETEEEIEMYHVKSILDVAAEERGVSQEESKYKNKNILDLVEEELPETESDSELAGNILDIVAMETAPEQTTDKYANANILDMAAKDAVKANVEEDITTQDEETITPVEVVNEKPKASPKVKEQDYVIGEKPVMADDGRVVYQRTIDFTDSKIAAKPIHVYKPYMAPPIDLLHDAPVNVATVDENYEESGKKLEKILSDFRIETHVENIVVGPTVTRYELSMGGSGVSVKKVIALADDISMGLSASSGVRIEAPIPNKALFGVEVPNRKTSVVALKDVMDSSEYYNSKGALNFSLGIDIGGERIIGDLAEMPHLLICGTTGVGKSVCLESILISMMYKYSPEELRFILVDPKNVEFFLYKNSPHLLINDIINDADKCVVAMDWLVEEMDARYKIFPNYGVKDIVGYNKVIDRKTTQVMPRIVLMIDELNDLMSIKKAEIENDIKRLSQKARAAGIHIICATQRPSVDVITGVIKSNIPCRVALKTSSVVDSMTILGEGGAEKLMGRGDMLYVAPLASKPLRLQGAYVSIEEIDRVINYIAGNNEAYYDEDITNSILNTDAGEIDKLLRDDENLDPLFPEILQYICTLESTSISMLQRRFNIGYNRAGKIIESLAQNNYISGFEGAKSRRVLITMEDYEKLYKKR